MLTSGTKLGPYEILSPLGAGGMGEVYRARDTRLERTVAIKILPANLSSDPVRRQRFEREAKIISNLNHPHICILHDIGHQDDTDYLVMECIEGETLEKRLEKGALALEQVVKIGAEVADALDQAHRSGVVHRDLKPGNIMLTSTGAKLLDFGLAKPAMALATAATLTASEKSWPVTEQGTIVGTFQYMSPEQVEGKDVDGRSDIFSLGAVLYEMVTGKRAFAGKSRLSVVAAILEKEPEPITNIKPTTPPALDHVIRRCLAKDPEDRWQTGRDLAQELKWVARAENVAARQETALARLIRGSTLAWTLAVAFLGLVAVAMWGWMRTPAPISRPIVRWTAVFPHGYTFPSVTLSPDGSHLAYLSGGGPAGPRQLYVRAMDQLEAKPISNEPRLFGTHFFSPDGRRIAYYSQGKLKKVPTAGGSPITICDAPVPSGGAWGADGTIILGGGINLGGLSRVSAAGGKLEVLTTPDPQKGEIAHGWPHFLPSGKAVLFSILGSGNWDDARIAVLDLRTREQRVLLQGGGNPRYAPTGHLIYARGGSLFAVPFDAERLQIKGTPSPVLEGVSWYGGSGFADYSFSESGDLVYVPSGADDQKAAMVWVDRQGKTQTIEAPVRAYANPSISPEGQRIAVSIEGGSPDDWDIWVYDLGRRTLTKLTYGSLNLAPAWTPDGTKVTFRNRNTSGQNGLFWVPADGSGPPEQLLATDIPATPGSWSPDGSALVFYQGARQRPEVRLLPIQPDAVGASRKAQTVLRDAVTPQLSPDGRWLAYALDEGGIRQVFVQPFPGLVGKWQVSTDGGHSPRWARGGRELFYRNGDKMMAVEVETKATFRAGTPRVVFEGTYATSPAPLQPGMGYDVAPDGKRFLMIKPSIEPSAAGQLLVVENWFDELRRRAPAAK